MDLPPTPDPGPRGGGDDGDDEIALVGWLAEVEGRLTAIDARLALLESSLRPAVAEEVQAGTADLRRALTELGRRLVTDLPHELARHRDAILAELRPPAPPEPPPLPEEDVEEVAEVVTVPPEPADATDPPEGADTRRVARRRRRHP
jgi:hypothetical protein